MHALLRVRVAGWLTPREFEEALRGQRRLHPDTFDSHLSPTETYHRAVHNGPSCHNQATHEKK